MELVSNPLVEQVQRFQRWAAGALPEPMRALLPQPPSARRAGAPRDGERGAPAVALRRRAAPFAAIIPGDSVVEAVVSTGLYNFINLYNTALIIRLVLTWFPNPPEVIVSPLSTVCDPYLNLFRGVVPPLGGTLDLSPILAFLVLNVFQGTAAALPCELPPEPAAGPSRAAGKQRLGARGAAAPGAPRGDAAAAAARASGVWAPLSRYQAAWASRVAAARQRRAAEAGARA